MVRGIAVHDSLERWELSTSNWCVTVVKMDCHSAPKVNIWMGIIFLTGRALVLWDGIRQTMIVFYFDSKIYTLYHT